MALLILLAFAVGVIIVLALFFAGSRMPGALEQRRLDTRLLEVTRPIEEPKESGAPQLVKTARKGPLPALDRFAGGTARGSALAHWIEQSGMRVTISGVLMIAIGLAVLLGMIVSAIVRAPWGMPVGGAVGFSAPFFLLKMKRKRRLYSFEEHFPEALDLISRALKAGHAFATGLKMVADELAEPIGPEFRKTFDEQNFGLPLKDALDNLTVRIPILDVRFFATAVMIQRETGGNLSEILENLGHVVRERFKILRQVRVYTAHGRLTGYVLLALPAFLAVALMFINPDHMNLLFREPLGQKMVMAGIVMQTVGYVWIQKVIKIEV
jgi:tight adherence protein B